MQIAIHESERDISAGIGDNEAIPCSFQKESFVSDVRCIRTAEQLKQFITLNIDHLFDRILDICYQSNDQAEEVLQELYPRLIRFLETQPQGIRDPWAATCHLAQHLAIDEHRRAVRKRHEPLPDDDTFASIHREDDVLIDDEQNIHLHLAIRRLAPRLANIIEGLFFDGRSGKHIASELGLSESRLSELKSAALAQLRAHLKENCLSMP